MYVSTAVVRAVSAELRRAGVSAEDVLAAVGLSPLVLKSATERVSLSEEGRFVTEAMRHAGPDLGLRIGGAAPMQALHVVGPLVFSAGTIRKAAGLFVRYAPWLIEGARYELFENATLGTMRYTNPLEQGDHARFCAELNMAFFYRFMKEMVGQDLHVEVIRFAHASPPYVAKYRELFDCPVEFDRPANEISVDAAALDVEHFPADESLRSLLERRADELLSMLGAAIPFDKRVREQLGHERELSHVAISSVAARLGVGAKTLQRRLSEAGSSWSLLMEAEQKRRAFELLTESSVPVKELAFRVGFSDATGFHRAFKRWTGMTPAEYRRLHKGEADL